MSVAEEIFGVRAVKKSKKNSNRSKANGETARRPDGVSREVYFLTGGATPASIAPTISSTGLQSKPAQKRSWVRQQFSNAARQDGLKLEHWVRVGDQTLEYPFAKFNRPIRIVTYSSAEYEAVVKNLAALGPVKPLSTSEVGRRQPLPKRPRLGGSRAGVLPGSYSVVNSSDERAGEEVCSAPPAIAGAINDHSQSETDSAKVDTAKSFAGGSASQLSSASTSQLPIQTTESYSHNNRREVTNKIQELPSIPTIQARLRTTDEASQSISQPFTAAASSTASHLLSDKKAIQYVPPQKLWTREETDELFRLCEQFDLRFPVIHDRWPDSLAPRSIDELKDRYYSVVKVIMEYRVKLDKAALSKLPLALQKHCQMISMTPFDYEYECIRKNQLDRQYRRSKEELREEEETVRNARRIESNQRRLKKERERLAKLLTPAGDVLMTGPDGKRVVDAKLAMVNATASQSQKLFSHRKVNTGAYALSSLIYTPVTQSARIAKRIDQVLEELKVGTRPTPTSHVVDTFDLLRLDIMSFLELYKTLLRKEEETHALRVRLAKLKGEPIPDPPIGVVLLQKKRRADDSNESGLPAPLFS